jgi:hypothetical protein
MKPATEQLLATLELLTDGLKFEVPRETDVWHYITPFSWDIEAQGELNALNLLKFKGAVQLTDAEVAITNWQAIEQQGTPTEGHYLYAPERDERENILDEATQAKRIAAYQSLLELLKAELQELQVYSFSGSQGYSYRNGIYTSYAIVGRTQDNDWICLASTVPEQTELKDQEISRSSATEISASKPLGAHTTAIVSRIAKILTELPPLEIYGYYSGGYNYTYEHEIIYKLAAIRELAFENAADLVEIDKFNGFYLDKDYFCKKIHYDYEAEEEDLELDQLYLRYQNLNQFLTQNLSNLTVYRFIFWDWDYIYVLGQTQAGDWLGVETTNEFVYNP